MPKRMPQYPKMSMGSIGSMILGILEVHSLETLCYLGPSCRRGICSRLSRRSGAGNGRLLSFFQLLPLRDPKMEGFKIRGPVLGPYMRDPGILEVPI